jgi:hypothetical protein
MNWVSIFIILFIFALLWRRIVLRFSLCITEWKRKHSPDVPVKTEGIVRFGLGFNLFSSITSTVYAAGIIYVSFWLADFPMSVAILIGTSAVITWLLSEALLFFPAEKFKSLISRLPASLTASKNYLRNWMFVFVGLILVGWLFLGSILLIALQHNK